jgi:predicted CopG family antitoxin
MMRSVRLDDEMEQQLLRAAELEEVSVSEFIRRAASERTERTLSVSAAERLADVVGAVHGRHDQARRTGAAFTEALTERRRTRG